MAFPAIQTADTKNGTVTSNSNSWTLTYPTNLASGDLIVAIIATDGAPSGGSLFPAGWTSLFRYSSAVSSLVGLKSSDGTETGNFSVGLGASEQGGWRVFRITGWVGGSFSFPAGGDLSFGGEITRESGGVAVHTAASSSLNPDPPSVGPTWGAEDTLWLAVCAVDTSRTISVYPLANNQTADVSGGSNGATLGICMKNDAVASLDPGTFTISNSDDWVAAIIAIRPLAASPPGPPVGAQFVS